MKTTLSLLGATLALALPLDARQVDVDDWYAIRANASTTAAITNGTNTANFQNIGNQALDRVFSYFDPITFTHGTRLTFSFDLTLQLSGVATHKDFNVFRFGLFNASTPHATPALFTNRTAPASSGATYTSGWSGFLLINPNSPIATNPLTLYRKTGAGDFSSTSNATGTQSLPTTGGYSMSFEEGVARTFTLELIRNNNDLVVSGSYGSGTFSNTYAGAFGTLGTYDLINAFGLYAAASDGVVIESAQFSNVSLQVVPEPSSLALLLGPGVIALGFLLRRPTAQR